MTVCESITGTPIACVPRDIVFKDFRRNKIPSVTFGDDIRITRRKLTKSLHRAKMHLLRDNHNYCADCGAKLSYFLIVFNDREGSHSLHPIAINADGTHIQLTLDHIVPKSRGGTDNIENLQILCVTCNQNKGARVFGSVITKGYSLTVLKSLILSFGKLSKLDRKEFLRCHSAVMRDRYCNNPVDQPALVENTSEYFELIGPITSRINVQNIPVDRALRTFPRI